MSLVCDIREMSLSFCYKSRAGSNCSSRKEWMPKEGDPCQRYRCCNAPSTQSPLHDYQPDRVSSIVGTASSSLTLQDTSIVTSIVSCSWWISKCKNSPQPCKGNKQLLFMCQRLQRAHISIYTVWEDGESTFVSAIRYISNGKELTWWHFIHFNCSQLLLCAFVGLCVYAKRTFMQVQIT